MTDSQRIVIYISVVTAVFLAAMALGWRNAWLLLAAVAVLSLALSGVAVVVARRGAGAHEIATAQVISVSARPHNAGIAARCDMQLEVRLAGRPPIRTRHRDPAVPLTRWPRPGQTYPVDVVGGNPRRRLHIRWDLVEQGMLGAPDQPPPAGASQAPLWEEENEPVIFSPTPPRPRRPAAAPPPPPAGAAAAAPVDPSAPAVFLHETFTDIDEGAQTPPPPSRDAPPATHGPPGADPNGHDPDGYDPADFETPHLSTPPAAADGAEFEAITLADFDPAEVDIRDFTGEPPAVTVMPTDDEPGLATTAPGPSAATGAPSEATPPPIPQPRDPDSARGGGGTSATLPVADLPRALRFYRDALGFTVASASSDRAVLEHRGTRILLETTATEVPAASIHIDVADIEATCAAAEAHAGKVVERPAPTPAGFERSGREAGPERSGREAGQRLWRARLRDPDGHAVELSQWRQGGG